MEILSKDSQIIFCVKDTEPFVASISAVGRGELNATVREVLACFKARKILITTTSRIWASCPRLYSAFLDEVTVNGLIENHFKRDLMRAELKSKVPTFTEVNSPKLKYLLFPFDEAMTLLSLRASGLVSNDDNVRFVKFARRLAEKGNVRAGADIFPLPELVHNPNAGRLSGIGYGRMCKALQNHLPLRSTQIDVERFVDKLSSMHAYFDKFPSELAKYEMEKEDYVFLADYLPLMYGAYFGGDAATKPVRLAVRDLSSFLASLKTVLWELLKKIQTELREVDVSSDWVFEKIEADSEVVAKIASETERIFMQYVAMK